MQQTDASYPKWTEEVDSMVLRQAMYLPGVPGGANMLKLPPLAATAPAIRPAAAAPAGAVSRLPARAEALPARGEGGAAKPVGPEKLPRGLSTPMPASTATCTDCTSPKTTQLRLWKSIWSLAQVCAGHQSTSSLHRTFNCTAMLR